MQCPGSPWYHNSGTRERGKAWTAKLRRPAGRAATWRLLWRPHSKSRRWGCSHAVGRGCGVSDPTATAAAAALDQQRCSAPLAMLLLCCHSRLVQDEHTAESSQQQDVQPPAKRQRGAAEPAGPDGGSAGGSKEPIRLVLTLSEPLLLRVLSFLPPDDLLALSQTCRQLRAAASDGAIWRRLYHSRCGSREGQEPPLLPSALQNLLHCRINPRVPQACTFSLILPAGCPALPPPASPICCRPSALLSSTCITSI